MHCLICLRGPAGSHAEPPAELSEALLKVVPRIRVERGVVWADARGLPPRCSAETLVERAHAIGWEQARAGVAATPTAAALAARGPAARAVTIVEPKTERAFVAPFPVALLEPDDRLDALLRGVGIRTCGALARLDREAVEVRFGVDGVRLWRRARAEDRLVFAPIPRALPHASLDFADFAVREAPRLLFTVNALLERVCGELQDRASHARRLTLELTLEGGGTLREPIRSARPTARKDTWIARVRDGLNRLELPDAVAGVALWAEPMDPLPPRQGDLFDRGFATAGAVEAAVAEVIDRQGPMLVAPEHDAHPLAERSVRWRPRTPAEAVAALPAPTVSGDEISHAHLTLQRLPDPCRIEVVTELRRGVPVPARYRHRHGWRALHAAAGPDRVSGSAWEAPFARDYFRCVSEAGRLLWIFRDERKGGWYLHGWWD